MSWGWIVLIALFALSLVPLFVPLVVRVRAEPGRFEYAIAYGPVRLMPGGPERFARWGRNASSAGRVLLYPIALAFRAIGSFITILSYPFRLAARLVRRRKRPAPWEEEPAREWFEREQWPEEEEPEEAPPEEPRGWSPPEDEEPPAEPPPPEEEEEPERGRGPRTKRGARLEQAQRAFRRAHDGYRTARTFLDAHGRTARRTLRALVRFSIDCLRAFRFRTLDVRWRAGGDPAVLGQLLGWHHALVASIDPRLARNVRFEPAWDEDRFLPAGNARVVLAIWPFRFVPPTVLFLTRLPWPGLIRLVRKQILQRR
ncbi:MAG: hypothetical protein MAG453_01129 [Calditrichaeota bacterium]|nr:hypothetical protein [Calditrichota bacterium]